MDPLVQLVKELLESSDPEIKVVVCLPDHGPACAKSGPDLALKPLDSANPSENPRQNSPDNSPQNSPDKPSNLPDSDPK
jgi:hypothetical protein